MNVFNMQFDVCKGDIFFIKFKLYFNDMADHWIQEAGVQFLAVGDKSRIGQREFQRSYSASASFIFTY